MSLYFLYYSLTFFAGAFFGSFYNVIADRSVNGESILLGRSHCDFCKKILKAINLIPLFSFIFQKGRCAFCKKKLSWFYPLSEVLAGLSFVLAAYSSQIFVKTDPVSILLFLYYVFVFGVFVIIFLTDAKYRLIPNRVIYSGIIVAFTATLIIRAVQVYLIYAQLKGEPFGLFLLKTGYINREIMSELIQLGKLVISSFGIAGFFGLLFFLTKGRGMGGGDVKLGLFIGIVNDYPLNVLAIFLGFVIGAVYSLFLIILKKKTIKDTVPFGPFLILGSIISLYFGRQILNWYIGII